MQRRTAKFTICFRPLKIRTIFQEEHDMRDLLTVGYISPRQFGQEGRASFATNAGRLTNSVLDSRSSDLKPIDFEPRRADARLFGHRTHKVVLHDARGATA